MVPLPAGSGQPHVDKTLPQAAEENDDRGRDERRHPRRPAAPARHGQPGSQAVHRFHPSWSLAQSLIISSGSHGGSQTIRTSTPGHARYVLQGVVDRVGEVAAQRAARSGQRHRDRDCVVAGQPDVVEQAEVDDVDADLRVDDVAEEVPQRVRVLAGRLPGKTGLAVLGLCRRRSSTRFSFPSAGPRGRATLYRRRPRRGPPHRRTVRDPGPRRGQPGQGLTGMGVGKEGQREGQALHNFNYFLR